MEMKSTARPVLTQRFRIDDSRNPVTEWRRLLNSAEAQEAPHEFWQQLEGLKPGQKPGESEVHHVKELMGLYGLMH